MYHVRPYAYVNNHFLGHNYFRVCGLCRSAFKPKAIVSVCNLESNHPPYNITMYGLIFSYGFFRTTNIHVKRDIHVQQCIFWGFQVANVLADKFPDCPEDFLFDIATSIQRY